MNRVIRALSSPPLFALVLLAVAVAPAHAAQRTFVSTGGNDANACSLASPCRGFAKAITVTDPGGELVVLDSGGYGSVTINKNVTVLSPAGVYAGISVFAASDGIIVASPATKVVLRGLTINGQGGNNGVRVQVGEVHLESTVISNLDQAGIRVEGGSTVRISGTVSRSNADGLRIAPGAGAVSVLVRDSEFSNNSTAGIGVSPSAGGANAQVTVERSSVTKNGAGVVTAPGASASATVIVTQSVLSENTAAGVSSIGSTATVYVRESAITRNGTGLLQASSGVLNACGANLLVANTTPQSGAITTASCLDIASGSGTMTNLAQGAGITLTPSPITASGTVAADTTYLQRRVSGTCAAGSSIRTINSDGTVVCELDDAGAGTVTSVGTGTGLTGGPITAAGTVSIANGGVGNTQLANASVDVAKLNTASTDARYFKQGGNGFGAAAFLGTTDNHELDFFINSAFVLRLLPGGTGESPNVIAGYSGNSFVAPQNGQTIGGGGHAGTNCLDPITGFLNRSCVNVTSREYATIGGGYSNVADALAVIGGGDSNDAGFAAVVGGGEGNAAIGGYSSVGGGLLNVADGNRATISGGVGNATSADFATVIGGRHNTASGPYAVAAGHDANATHDKSFVWGGWAAGGATSYAPNRFHIMGQGGLSVDYGAERGDGGGTAWIVIGNGFAGQAIATYTGAFLSTDGHWVDSSDATKKTDFIPIDSRDVLARVTRLPITTWRHIEESGGRRHLGPMAQDFWAAFRLGDDDRHIGVIDEGGVALAAIQGLYAELGDRDATIAQQQRQIAELHARLTQVEALRDRLTEVERLRDELARFRSAVAQASRSESAAKWPD